MKGFERSKLFIIFHKLNFRTLGRIKTFIISLFCRLLNVMGMLKILWLILFIVNCFASGTVLAQPYFDAAGVSGWHMPQNLNGDGISETEGYFFISFPFDVNRKNKLIVSPFYETRMLETESNRNVTLKSTTLPVAWLYQPNDSAWSFLAFAAFRSNSTQFRFNGDVFQVAGAVMVNYKVTPTLTLKTGVYLSKEFYGDFFMYLVGIDWKINSRMNLFGLVNNNLRFEYRVTEKIFGGFSFKAINNSYRSVIDGGYYKISDNHLCTYADISLGKKLVWNLEAGHTIFRYIKGRNGAGFPHISNDGFIFKTGLAYRIRFKNVFTGN